MSIVEIHARLGNAALIYFAVVSLWGYWRFFRKQGIDGAYRGALAIGIMLLIAQAGLGAAMWLGGLRPGRSVHLLYGIVSIVAVPLAYAYTRGRMARPEMLVYSTTTLITVGLILRAITTAS